MALCALKFVPFDVAVQETGDPTEERNCLVRCATLGSPFLCTCSYAFSAGHWLVLAMPLYSGGSLETVINERGEFGMGDDDLLWVAANMALGDYGLVSHIGISDRHGSRSYWSPECVNEDPQGTFSDWWSYGVTIAQCSTGRHPFMRRWVRSHKCVPDAPPPPWDEAKVDVNIDQWKAPNEADLDEADLNYNTLYKPVEFKAEGPHVDLIKACLDRDTKTRVSSGLEIRERPFFAERIDWDLLAKRQLPSPIAPNSRLIYAPAKSAVRTTPSPTDVVHPTSVVGDRFEHWDYTCTAPGLYADELHSLVSRSTTQQLLVLLSAPANIKSTLPALERDYNVRPVDLLDGLAPPPREPSGSWPSSGPLVKSGSSSTD